MIFPETFVWGAATSAYQIEGGRDERGTNIWDTFVQRPNAVLDNSTADIADDHYHRVNQDVALMKHLRLKAYRFSIAWSRILPHGTEERLNQAGIDFYNHLIDRLLEHDIEPWVTLYHFDLPQTLQDHYGGWMDRRTVDAFARYARVCFQAFGDRVTRWITINEAWTVAVNGYATGIHAPGHVSPTEPYIVGHHLILAHAHAAHIYRTEFGNGVIGLANSADYRYPRTNTTKDWHAANRAMLFQFGWFAEPFFLGDYPAVMRKRLGKKLPQFTHQERQLIMGSGTPDFVGVNYYSSFLASRPLKKASYEGYWADIDVNFTSDKKWRQNDMGWNVVPDGLLKMLLWISERYNFPLLYITENGTAERGDKLAKALNDTKRIEFLESHLLACAQAIEAGVRLEGYFTWSLMDNFEWQLGYTKRFGICYVDYDTLERIPKLSATWYRATIQSNGEDIQRQM